MKINSTFISNKNTNCTFISNKVTYKYIYYCLKVGRLSWPHNHLFEKISQQHTNIGTSKYNNPKK